MQYGLSTATNSQLPETQNKELSLSAVSLILPGNADGSHVHRKKNKHFLSAFAPALPDIQSHEHPKHYLA